MTRITNRMVRKDLLDSGAERVVIRRSGEVHAYGRMPNSIETGWYYAGNIDRLKAMLRVYLNAMAT
jgi:hypothetical protein